MFGSLTNDELARLMVKIQRGNRLVNTLEMANRPALGVRVDLEVIYDDLAREMYRRHNAGTL